MEARCHRCGSSLESAQRQVRTSVGLLLNEFQLSDFAAARLLAHTDELVVECQDCGARNEVKALGEQQPVPESGTHRPESTASPAAGPTRGSRPASTGGWSPAAVELYRDLVRARLVGAHCHRCGAPLESALLPQLPQVRTSAGLLLNEFGFGDLAAARLLADTDDLVVGCQSCGACNEVRSPSKQQEPSSAVLESETPRPESTSSPAARPTLESRLASTGGWSPAAVELYRDLVGARLVGAHCHRCRSSRI